MNESKIFKKTLSINCLSDDMLKCAAEKGYRTPCINIKQYYNNPAKFIINFKDNLPLNYELEISDNNGKFLALYLM